MHTVLYLQGTKSSVLRRIALGAETLEHWSGVPLGPFRSKDPLGTLGEPASPARWNGLDAWIVWSQLRAELGLPPGLMAEFWV